MNPNAVKDSGGCKSSFFKAKGLNHTSPGHRPGFPHPRYSSSPEEAAQRAEPWYVPPLQGSGLIKTELTGAMPRADMFRTIGAEEIRILKGIGMNSALHSIPCES
jgi:hypothetical protein